MDAVRRNLRQWSEDERPFLETWVRYVCAIPRHHCVTQQQEIEIERTRRVAKAPCPAEARLNEQKCLDQPLCVEGRLQLDNSVQEGWLRRIADWRRLVQGRNAGHDPHVA
jgi:hypothetical protein